MIAIVTIVCASGATVAAFLDPTVYTGRSALTAASQTRSPEQDAYLAQGYAEYFNQPSYQETLRVKAGIPPGLTYNSRTAATSPIVYVEATGTNQAAAVAGAAAMADAFRDDVNAGNRSSGVAAADNANDLRTLQRQASFSAEAADPVRDGLLGLAGGFILACAIALLLAAIANRIVTADDVRDKLDLDTLAVIRGNRGRRGSGSRDEEMKGLANVVGLSDFSRPVVIALTTPRESSCCVEVADGLARHRATQGERTLVVQADLRTESGGRYPGVADLLTGSGRVRPADVILPGAVRGMRVLASGSTAREPYALFGPQRFVRLIGELRWMADLIVIEAPPVIDAAESQVICAAADHTVMVLEEDVTTTSDAEHAYQLLDRVHADVIGAVIVRPDPSGPVTFGPDPDAMPALPNDRPLPSPGEGGPLPPSNGGGPVPSPNGAGPVPSSAPRVNAPGTQGGPQTGPQTPVGSGPGPVEAVTAGNGDGSTG